MTIANEATAHRGGVAHVEVGERLVEEQDVDRLGRVGGAALGHDEDDVERLQRVDRPEQDRDHERRPQERQRDVPEALDRRRAVEVRGLIGLARQACEPGEGDEHDQRCPLPDVHERQGIERRLARVRPAERERPTTVSMVVRDAERRVVHHHEHEGDGGGRRHHRQDRQGAQQAASPELAVEEERHRDAEDRLGRDGHDREVDRPHHGFPEPRVAHDDLRVVRQADEARPGQAGGEPFLKAHPARVDDRVDDDRGHEHDGRRGEEPLRVTMRPTRQAASSRSG